MGLRSAQAFAMSTFLNHNIPEEKWLEVAISEPASLPAGLLVVGNHSGALVDGRALKPSNYFHFLLQTVPEALKHTRNRALVLRTTELKPWQEAVFDTLNLLLRETRDGEKASFALLKQRGVYPERDSVHLLRAAVLESIGLDQLLPPVSKQGKQSKPRLLFINRSDKTSRFLERMVADLEGLEQGLSKRFDVRIEELGTHSFVDQLRLVNWADVICGPHGSGLSNIALCFQNPGPRIVEFVHASNARWHHERTSMILGFDYLRVAVPTNTEGKLEITADMIPAVSKE